MARDGIGSRICSRLTCSAPIGTCLRPLDCCPSSHEHAECLGEPSQSNWQRRASRSTLFAGAGLSSGRHSQAASPTSSFLLGESVCTALVAVLVEAKLHAEQHVIDGLSQVGFYARAHAEGRFRFRTPGWAPAPPACRSRHQAQRDAQQRYRAGGAGDWGGQESRTRRSSG